MDRVWGAHLLEHYRRLRSVGRRPGEQLNHRDAFLLLTCRVAGVVASSGEAARCSAHFATTRKACTLEGPDAGGTPVGVEGEEQPAVPEQRIRRDLDVPRWSCNRKVGARLLASSARSACRVAIKDSVALRIASAASQLLGFVDGKPLQACSRFCSCPVFRQPAVVGDPGEFFESSGRRRQRLVVRRL